MPPLTSVECENEQEVILLVNSQRFFFQIFISE